MAIAVDATSSGVSSSSPLVVSHTISGSDRVLIVFVMSTDGGGTPSVTYNGVSMTLIVSRNISDEMKGFAFGLEDPDTGTHDISVTGITASRSGVSAVSFTGAGGWDASAAASGNNSSSADASVTVNTNRTGDGYVAASAIVNVGTTTLTYLGDGTEFANFNSDNVDERIAAAYTPFSSGANITEDWSKSATVKWCAVGVEVYQSGNIYSQNLDETVTMVDTVTKTTSRALAEVATMVDTIIRTPGKVFAEVATMVDTVEALRVANILLDEVITLVDTIVRDVSKALSETATMVDTVGLVGTFIRSFDETLTIEDVFTKITTKVLTETVEIVDSVEKTLSRALDEAVTIVASVTNIAGKVLSEAVSLVDTLTRTAGKALTETVTLADHVSVFLNGILQGLWAKTARITSSWSSVVRKVSDWTKIDRE